jgi:hypothetical protein
MTVDQFSSSASGSVVRVDFDLYDGGNNASTVTIDGVVVPATSVPSTYGETTSTPNNAGYASRDVGYARTVAWQVNMQFTDHPAPSGTQSTGPSPFPPTAPVLSGSHTGYTATLSWTNTGTAGNNTTYTLYRNGTVVHSGSSRRFSENVPAAPSYTYKVVASNSNGTSPDSNLVTLKFGADSVGILTG